MSEKRLRISHVEVRPVLVWDDGDELTPGPPLQPQALSLSRALQMLDALPAEVEALAAQLATQPATDG